VWQLVVADPGIGSVGSIVRSLMCIVVGMIPGPHPCEAPVISGFHIFDSRTVHIETIAA
jgi:hypothetical protein